MTSNELRLSFGAMVRPLADQLGVKPVEVEPLQKDADAVTRLLVRGRITAKEGERARRKILRDCARFTQESADGN